MGWRDWFRLGRKRRGGVSIKILEVNTITKATGQVFARVSIDAYQVQAVGLKCRLVSVGDSPEVAPEEGTGDELCHGEMNDLVEAVVGDEGPFIANIEFPYDLRPWLEQQGGLLAVLSRAVGMVTESFQSKSHRNFFLQVQCSVGEHWKTPTDCMAVSVLLSSE